MKSDNFPVIPAGANALLMVAGEASADLHGSMVVRELKRRYPDLFIFGIGGPLMIAEGFVALAESSEISVMGLTEVIMALPRIIGIGRRLLTAADHYKPVAALLLDLPDFNLRLAGFLKKRQIPVLYYISPQVWAWRQGRIKKIKKLVTEMLVILPFEEDLYRKHQVPVTFVGHPLVEEQGEQLPASAAVRQQLTLPAARKIVALLPGSRRSEIKRHIDGLLAAAAILQQKYPGIGFVLPVAAGELRPLLETAAAAYPGLNLTILAGHSKEALLACDVAAVCSGTATLQTALLGRPMVVLYRLSQVSYFLLSRLVKVQAISLVNLIAGKPLVQELIQADFTAERLADELSHLLDDPVHYDHLQEELKALHDQLGAHRASVCVADVCAKYLKESL